jgi:hypothetical protein
VGFIDRVEAFTLQISDQAERSRGRVARLDDAGRKSISSSRTWKARQRALYPRLSWYSSPLRRTAIGWSSPPPARLGHALDRSAVISRRA